MLINRQSLKRALACTFALLLGWNIATAPAPADAQFQQPLSPPLQYKVEGGVQRLEMTLNSSRIMTMEGDIPRAQVNNPEILKITPLATNQVQVSAIKAGVTQVNLWDKAGRVYTVDIIVSGDGRELQLTLEKAFPNSSLVVTPINGSVMLTGFVDRADSVSAISEIAKTYYPNVINRITVGGVQQVQLKVKVMEVSRTKLRAMGFDWANVNGPDFVVSSVSGLISAAGSQGGSAVGLGGDTIRFGMVDGNNSFFGFLEALRQYNLAKILAEPTITTVSGRPASFNVGGEFPILVPQSLGTVSIEYKNFGTRLDFVPIVLGNGSLRLEVRPQVSEIDPARSVTINNVTVPGLRTRWVDTAVEMKAGQTLALAGLIQTRTEAENKGIPLLADLPWLGAAFRRVEETTNEIELVVLVTPELVSPLDPHEVPPCGPGQFTTSPSDHELYGKGYIEVPKCAPGGMPMHGYGPGPGAMQPQMERVQPGVPQQGIPQPQPSGSAYRQPQRPAGQQYQGQQYQAQQNPQRQYQAQPVAMRKSQAPPADAYRQNQYSQQNPQGPGYQPRNSQPMAAPALIGPTGYDVLE